MSFSPLIGCIRCDVSGEMCRPSVSPDWFGSGRFLSLWWLFGGMFVWEGAIRPMNRFNLLTMVHWAYSFKTRTLIRRYMQWCHSLLRGGIYSPFLPLCGLWAHEKGHHYFKKDCVNCQKNWLSTFFTDVRSHALSVMGPRCAHSSWSTVKSRQE